MRNPDEFTPEQWEEIDKLMHKAAQYIGEVLRQKGVIFATDKNQNVLKKV